MPQSARATFKLTKPASALARLAFQCLNRHEQPSSTPPGHRPGPYLNGFNASIGTSNLQALPPERREPPCPMVSMPQSARATFKPLGSIAIHILTCQFQCLNRHEQPSSLSFRAGFALGRIRFQCLNRHEQPSSEKKSDFRINPAAV